MNIKVRFFAWLQDAVSTPECWLVLGPGARGFDAKAALIERYVQLSGLIDHARLAVNQEYRPWEASLHDGDEIGLIPPVSGG